MSLMKLQLALILGAFLCCFAVTASPALPQPLCLLLTRKARTIFPDPLLIPNIKIPIKIENKADVMLTGQNITMEGLKNIKFKNCTVGVDLVVISDVISTLTVDFEYYKMNGTLVNHLDIYGAGHASIVIEDLFVGIYGNLTSKTPGFDYLQIDLDMYQWTVKFEHLMDGTDLGTLFNEFMSEVGPETMDALSGLLNNKYNEQFTAIINKAITAFLVSPP